jgi:copper chaperone CopZ
MLNSHPEIDDTYWPRTHLLTMDTSVELKVEGMTCGACANSVSRKLSSVDGVSSASVDLAAGKATVQLDDSRASVEDLIAAISQIGFSAARG